MADYVVPILISIDLFGNSNAQRSCLVVDCGQVVVKLWTLVGLWRLDKRVKTTRKQHKPLHRHPQWQRQGHQPHQNSTDREDKARKRKSTPYHGNTSLVNSVLQGVRFVPVLLNDPAYGPTILLDPFSLPTIPVAHKWASFERRVG